MSVRRSPKYALKDAHAGPWTQCDDCGFIWSQKSMAFQYDFDGTSVPINQGVLKCPKCMDALNYQRRLIIIPPDPPMIFNTRPGSPNVDETNFLATGDDDILTTDDGTILTPSHPNPEESATVSELLFVVRQIGANLTNSFLDLHLGNPAATGGAPSLLDEITGSSVRSNVFSQLTVTTLYAFNPLPIVVAATCLNNAPVTHAALWDAASGGTLVLSGPCSASPTVQEGLTVRFVGNAIRIQLN